jgi:hypothetical protein
VPRLEPFGCLRREQGDLVEHFGRAVLVAEHFVNDDPVATHPHRPTSPDRDKWGDRRFPRWPLSLEGDDLVVAVGEMVECQLVVGLDRDEALLAENVAGGGEESGLSIVKGPRRSLVSDR